MLKFRFVYRTGGFEQVATVSTLDIKGIPADFIVIELDIGIKDCTTTGAGVGWTNGSKVCCYDRR